MTSAIMFRLFLASCALLGGTVSAMTLDEMIVDLENNLNNGSGTCEAGSIDALLNGSIDANCPAFTALVDAITAENEESSSAALSILLDSVSVVSDSFKGTKADFLEENTNFTFIPNDQDYDSYGCNIEEDKSIEVKRSDPKCIENRVNEAAAIQMMFKVTGGAISVADSDADAGTDIPPESDPEEKTDPDSDAGTDAPPESDPEEETDPDSDAGTDAPPESDLEKETDHDSDASGTSEEITDATPEEITDATPEEITDAAPEEITDATPEDITDATPEEATDATPEEVPDETTDPEDGDEEVTDETADPADGDEEVTDETTDPEDGDEEVTDETTDPEDGDEDVTDETTDTEDGDEAIKKEGIPFDVSTADTQYGDKFIETEGISLEVPFEAGYSEIPFDATDLPHHESAEFDDLECVNQTFVLDRIPSISEDSDAVKNSRRIQEQVFLINQKLLDYANVEQADYMAACEENAGVYRVVNTTTLCRRRSIFDSRIRQRVNYIGRNFPVCAGLQCEGKSDDDFGIVFAESLLTGNEFWDQTDEGEFWTCSGAFSASLQAVVGLIFAAVWYLL